MLPWSHLPSYRFWGLLISLAALFFLGGSSRSDSQSLVILNPLITICCGVSLTTLRREHWRGREWICIIIIIVVIVTALYMVPFPAELISVSYGIGEIARILNTTNTSHGNYTLLIAPAAGIQSFVFIFAPLTIIFFSIQLSRDDLQLTVGMILVYGTISGLIGVLQLAGGSSSPFYFYYTTNSGSAVGLFANRNHAAVFLACLFPMLALFAAKAEEANRGRNTRQLIAMAIAIILVPLILVTGSRSGMLTATVGLIGAALLYVSHAPSYRGSTKAKSATPIWAAAILVCLVVVTVYFSRAEAIERIFAENGAGNDRADFWTSGLQLFWQYFPLGFGPGGFVPAFQNIEPLALLNGAYLNRLHNDWLETALTFGVPGILLMLAGAGYYLRRSFVLWMRMDGVRSAVALGRMASIVIAILGIASLSDYPLRTPAMAGFSVLVLIWFAHARSQPREC